MKRANHTVLCALVSLVALAAQGQSKPSDAEVLRGEGRAPRRTEFISYDTRSEAEAGTMAGSKYFRRLAFKSASEDSWQATVEIPALWLDRNIYLRDEGRTGRYVIVVNGREVAANSDSWGLSDYLLTPHLREGKNTITLIFDEKLPGAELERRQPTRTTTDSLYIWSQPRIHIFDWQASGHFDEEFRDNVIDLAVVVASGYNLDEAVTVGYDVYDPTGRLVEYTFKEATIPGRGCDTVRFRGKITHAEKLQYSASNPALYRVIMTLRHGGRPIEYIPFRLGFGVTSWDGTDVWRGGRRIAIKSTEADFPVAKGAQERLRGLKKQGFNTIAVVRPQQKWFYDMCDAEGLWVIDRAAVECDPRGGDRGPNGTAANMPELVERFLDRQRAMFRRNGGRPSVIGWSIGSESGNGYNMYRSYLLLCSLDPSRPVIYPYAEGEWDTDL